MAKRLALEARRRPWRRNRNDRSGLSLRAINGAGVSAAEAAGGSVAVAPCIGAAGSMASSMKAQNGVMAWPESAINNASIMRENNAAYRWRIMCMGAARNRPDGA